jgi:hypothetical protein
MLQLRFLPESERVTMKEWVEMVRSPLSKGVLPETKLATAETLIFMATFEHRLGASSFAGIAAGSIYALLQDFSARHPIFLAYGFVAFFCFFINFTHVIGTNNELANGDAKCVGIVFAFGFWGPSVCSCSLAFGDRGSLQASERLCESVPAARVLPSSVRACVKTSAPLGPSVSFKRYDAATD